MSILLRTEQDEEDIRRIRAELARLERLRSLQEEAERDSAQEAAERARRWLYDPAGWIDEHLPSVSLTTYQAEIATDLVEYRRMAVRGPHGLGKTMLISSIILWFAITREQAGINWKIPTTASAWRHLNKFLWPEIHRWAAHADWERVGRPPFSERTELLDLNLKLRHGAASAVASSKSEFIEGAHADSLLYIIDEAKIVPDASWDAIEGALSGGRPEGLPEAFVLAVSTPGPPRGRFYDIHRRARGTENWHVRHVKLEEAVAAGRISSDWAEQMARLWGAGSALFANKVRGDFHQNDEDALIPLSWVEAAQERWHEWDEAGRPALEGARWIGVDVARTGADATILAHRTGVCIVELEPHPHGDTMQTVARVTPHVSRDRDSCTAVVDSLGVGGGVVDRMRELKLPVLAYTGSARTTFMDRAKAYGFNNTRSAAYWNMRELLDPAYEAQIMLPPDDLLTSDLTTPTWKEHSGVPPKIAVQSKEDVVEQLGRSPDRGDAVAMAFWAEHLRGPMRLGKPRGNLPVRSLSPLGGRGTVRSGGRSGLGPLG